MVYTVQLKTRKINQVATNCLKISGIRHTLHYVEHGLLEF